MNTISSETLKERLDASEQINLLDVREDHERAEFNIGGRHIPIGQIRLLETDGIEDWKDEEIIIYCRSGNRSGIAANILSDAGFSNPVNLLGGMLEWQEKYGG